MVLQCLSAQHECITRTRNQRHTHTLLTRVARTLAGSRAGSGAKGTDTHEWAGKKT
jgi:hypothetical protein